MKVLKKIYLFFISTTVAVLGIVLLASSTNVKASIYHTSYEKDEYGRVSVEFEITVNSRYNLQSCTLSYQLAIDGVVCRDSFKCYSGGYHRMTAPRKAEKYSRIYVLTAEVTDVDVFNEKDVTLYWFITLLGIIGILINAAVLIVPAVKEAKKYKRGDPINCYKD